MSQKKRSIRLKLLFYIIVASSCITFLFILLLLWTDLKSNINVADAQVNQMEKNVIPALKGSLWKFDESQINISLESFLSLPSVKHVELNWSEAQSGDNQIAMGEKDKNVVSDDLIRIHNLIYKANNDEEYHLGELIITTSDESAYNNLYKNAIYIGLLQSLKTLFISFIILLIFQKVLTRHILEIAKQSKKLNLSSLGNAFSLKRNKSNSSDELDEVVSALNQMRLKIQSDISQEQKTAAVLAAEIDNAREQEKLAFAAQKSDQDKSLFLASISHEIRTPMNAILGFTHLLKNANLKDSDKRYVDYIDRSADSLLILINNILDMSKLEANKTDVESIPFYFADVLEMVNATFTEQARKKSLLFNCTLDNSVPEKVNGDQNRLLQILNNLISNAIKFTSNGKVNVKVSCIKNTVASSITMNDDVISAESETVLLQFSVHDSGIGISKEYLPRLFDVFSQNDVSTTRKYGGTGLGMPIVHQLVKLLGGEINVESIIDVGTVAKVILPFNLCTTSQNIQPNLADKTAVILEPLNCRVLVVDDAEINQALMVSMLGSMGVQVSIAGNGKVAVEKAIQGEFDIVLMDIQMPVMNGFDAAKAIRQHNSEVRNVPIIALTANVMDGFKDACLAAGMDDYLCKPFEPNTLHEKIKGHLEPNRTLPLNTAKPNNTSEVVENSLLKNSPLEKISSVAESVITDEKNLNGINIEHGMKRWPNDTSEYFIHLLAFIEEIATSSETINTLLDAGKLQELKTFIHKISGSASFLALENLAEAAATIEKSLYFTKEGSFNNESDSKGVTLQMQAQYNNAVAEVLNNKEHIQGLRDLTNS